MDIAQAVTPAADPAAAAGRDLASLRQEHEALLAFVHASPVGLAQTDLLGQVERANPVIAMLLMPLTRRGGLDNLFGVLRPVAPDLAQRVAAYPHEHGIVCDGLRITLSLPDQPLQVVSLRLVKLDGRRLMAALVDITAQVQAEHERQFAEERLRLAMQAAQAQALDVENQALCQTRPVKSRFVAAMSHALRTPLTSVIGYTELMRGGVAVPGTSQYDDCLEHIASNGRHLLQIVNDVLDLARIETDRMAFSPAPLDLRELVQQVRDALGPQWLAKGLALRSDVADGLDSLVLDPMRMRQVLFNLLSNAVKFTPAGGHVELCAWPADAGTFVLEVADTGIGIRESELPRLFVAFQQLDAGSDRRHVGSGLGLALTRRLVQAQGGDVTVSSSYGQGSVFRVRMPMVHVPGPPAPVEAG